jgi:hypothetical protein
MGARYGTVIHVLQNSILTYHLENANNEAEIHILAHGALDHVCGMAPDVFARWMVSAFGLTRSNSKLQTFYIYSCDVAQGGQSILNTVATYVAQLGIQNKTFIGTVGENAVINAGRGVGKVLVLDSLNRTMTLGVGWKAYRTKRLNNGAVAEKLTRVEQIVTRFMNW